LNVGKLSRLFFTIRVSFKLKFRVWISFSARVKFKVEVIRIMFR